MRSIVIIALNTYRELIRDRILYALVVFAVLLIGLSMALGSLSFGEQTRITIDFGFAAVHLSVCTIAIFIGATLVSKEIEKKTILTLLARPVSRLQFLLGKSLGLVGLILTVMLGLFVILAAIFWGIGAEFNGGHVLGFYGIILEALVLLGITSLFGSLSRPFLTVSFTIGLFLIGHWINNLIFFTAKSESRVFQAFGQVVSEILPNLERVNWRSVGLYNEAIPGFEIFSASAYMVAWVVLLFTLASLIFGGRDFE